MNEIPEIVEPNGLPDPYSLRIINLFLEDQAIVDTTELIPNRYRPHSVSVSLDTSGNPFVATLELEIQWLTSGDFSIKYSETSIEDEQSYWRLDRHWNGSEERTHFHPSNNDEEYLKLALPNHLIQVISIVLANIESQLQ